MSGACSAPGHRLRPSGSTRSRTWPMLLRGSRGMAEAFAQGLWDSPDLVALIRLAARNAGGLDRLRSRLAPVRWPLQRAGALLRRSTKRRRRRDIAAHYDLGNELFARMLDPTMSYSCALFEHEGMTLEQAQVAKLERVCEQLDLGPGDRVLEIGTGWGAFALHAAATRGCHVTTTTISREQHDYAVEQVRARGTERPGHGADGGLPRAAGPLRQARLDRDDRGGRLAALRHLLRQVLGAAGSRRRDAAAGDHDRRPRLRGREGVEVVHQHPHLPRRMPALARGDRPQRRPANRPAGGGARGPDAALRRDAPALARRTSRPMPTSSRSAATTSASAGCGRSTSPTARPASRSGGSATSSCC